METILVIDDSAETLESLSLILEDAGYSVVCCREPVRAVQICREINFDLVLCDVYMHSSSQDASPLGGIDVIWSLSEEFPSLPIIAMSGYLEEEQLQKMQKANLAGAISKPFGRKELLEIVEKALKKGQ